VSGWLAGSLTASGSVNWRGPRSARLSSTSVQRPVSRVKANVLVAWYAVYSGSSPRICLRYSEVCSATVSSSRSPDVRAVTNRTSVSAAT
jgi:hypothetical protein